MFHIASKSSRNESVIIILGYHEVSEDTERHKQVRKMHPTYSLSLTKFKAQMEYLSNKGFKSVSLLELTRPQGNYIADSKRIAITFDDGYIGNFIYAFPVLQRCNLTATFFVIVGRIGSSHMLDWRQLVEMNKSGMSIQSHGMSHIPLASLPSEKIRYELLKSKEIIEDKIGEEVKFLSVPHGNIDSRCKEIAKEVGYQGICTSKIGYFTHHDYFEMERILIAERYTIEKFRRIMELDHLTITELKITKQLRNLLKRIIGIDTYRKVYRWLFNIRLPE